MRCFAKPTLVPRLTNVFPTQGLYGNYIPLPLVHLTDGLGFQRVHIAPEAFKVAQAEFPDQIDFWQNSLPRGLKGNLESVREQAILLLLPMKHVTAQRCPSPLD